MRRIYESEALRRDDDHFTPHRGDSESRPESLRSIDAAAWSHRLVPGWLGRRAISLSISAPETATAGTSVPFDVTMRNALPIPITLETVSPVVWEWSVDGIPNASHLDREPPEGTGTIHFQRGERKQFRRHWNGHFRVESDRWEPADSGTYTLGVAINVTDPAAAGLADETTVRLE